MQWMTQQVLPTVKGTPTVNRCHSAGCIVYNVTCSLRAALNSSSGRSLPAGRMLLTAGLKYVGFG